MGLRRGEVVGAVVVAAIQVGATAAAAHNQPAATRPYEPLAWGLLVLSAAGLLLRRRSPEAALVATSVPVWAYLALGYPGGPVFLAMIGALVGAIVRGHRLSAWVALAVGYPMFVWVAPLVAGQSPPALAAAVGVAAWLVAFAVVVELVKTRRDRAAEFRRTRAEEARRRAGEQRMAIARELHDVLAHHISLISVQAGVALHLMDEQPEQARTALTAIRQASRESLGELRSVLELLRHGEEGAPRAPAPGLEALDALVERTAAAGLPVTVEVTGTARPLPAAVGLAAYRIVQEALTNVTRHAGRPATATVRLGYAPDQLTVEVTDDGPGVEDTSGTGSGLLRHGRAGGGARRAARRRPAPGRRLPGDRPAAGTGAGAGVIRVLLADDQALVRAGFRALLDAQDDLSVVGEAADGAEAVRLAAELVPDVVLMDIRMPVEDGLSATRRIVTDRALDGVRVVVLTTFELDEYVFAAIRNGASGFLVKDTEPVDLLRAVRSVAAGDALLSPGVTRRLIAEFALRSREPAAAGQLAPLTEREREVLGLVGEGLTNDEIASRWVVSPATAKTHVNRAMAKLGARDRAQLVIVAYETGLVRPGWS